jgi:hypothetical protein
MRNDRNRFEPGHVYPVEPCSDFGREPESPALPERSPLDVAVEEQGSRNEVTRKTL